MARYSFNMEVDRSKAAFAYASDLNASYKDLCSVCDAIRYKSVDEAFSILQGIMEGRPILYRRHNKGMGARHELHGRKGRTPKKCASLVLKVLQNAYSNASNKGLDTSSLQVLHASANKVSIQRRSPPKGILYHRSGGEGYSMGRSSDLELSKVEIGLFDVGMLLGASSSAITGTATKSANASSSTATKPAKSSGSATDNAATDNANVNAKAGSAIEERHEELPAEEPGTDAKGKAAAANAAKGKGAASHGGNANHVNNEGK